MMRPLPLAACLALVSALPLHAFAQEAAQPPVEPAVTAEAAPTPTPAPVTPAAESAAPIGNAQAGKQLTYTCQGCHGVGGYKNAYPNYHVPRIGGQSRQYLVNALTEYRNNGRRHPTMEVQAKSFSDQDIADIAAFLSSLQQ